MQTYGEYQQYMNEMEKMFGKHGDFDVSLNRMNEASGKRESVLLGRVNSAKSNPSNRHGPRGGSSGGGNTSLGRNLSGSNSRVAAGKRPMYEEVSRRVVEDTSEKTVTISAWREKVAEEAEDVERMSVYWYTQKDYEEELSKSTAMDKGAPERSIISRSSGGSGGDGVIPEKKSPKVDHRISRSVGPQSSEVCTPFIVSCTR